MYVQVKGPKFEGTPLNPTTHSQYKQEQGACALKAYMDRTVKGPLCRERASSDLTAPLPTPEFAYDPDRDPLQGCVEKNQHFYARNPVRAAVLCLWYWVVCGLTASTRESSDCNSRRVSFWQVVPIFANVSPIFAQQQASYSIHYAKPMLSDALW